MRTTQSFPGKPVRVVVPLASGGGTDIQARVLSNVFSEQFGQPYVVDNRAGASGLIGAEAVAKSSTDAYILFITAALLKHA